MSNLIACSSDPSVQQPQADPRQDFQYVYQKTDEPVNTRPFLFLKKGSYFHSIVLLSKQITSPS